MECLRRRASRFRESMRRMKAPSGGCVGVVLALGLAALPAWLPASVGGDVVVVANPTVPVSSLSFTELRRIFLGDRQFWSSSLKISLLMPPPAARDREVLLKTVYEMSE